MKTDVVIVGSGLGGLEVALGLARKGLKPVVLERQGQAGGCMQSFRRGRLRLDTGLHYVGGLDEGESLNCEFGKYGLMQLPWQKMAKDGFEEVYIGGRCFRWRMGLEGFIDGMKADFPNESEGLDRFRDMLTSTDNEWLMSTGCWDFLSGIFHDKTLIEVLSAPAMCKMELASETLPLFTYQHGIAPFIRSSWRLKGDGSRIVDCLVAQIRELGGEVLTGKEVVELCEDGGRIIGAVTDDGGRYDAGWFVCDCHPAVMCQLVKRSAVMKNVFRRRMTGLQNTRGMFTVHIGLKRGALEYFNSNRIVLGGDSCWDYAVGSDLDVRNVMLSCRVPENGEMAENIDILTPMDWCVVEPFVGSAPMKRSKEYDVMKSRVAQSCIGLAETAVPHLSDMIDGVWTSSPLTYSDYNRTPNGSAFGFRKDWNNPLMTVVSPKTPIPNLLMTGQCLMVHGLEGVTLTAGYTIREIENGILKVENR